MVSDKKRIVSYNLGMAFAKFYAEKLLDIPSLVHVESLKALGSIEFLTLKMEKVESQILWGDALTEIGMFLKRKECQLIN